MTKTATLLASALVLACWTPAPAAAASSIPTALGAADEAETLLFEWRLGGFLGTLARLVFPGAGEGQWHSEVSDGVFASELMITASGHSDEDYWSYGARLPLAGPEPRTVWTAYRYKGKEKRKDLTVEQPDVLDLASGLRLLRTDPPREPRPMAFWWDGSLYGVVFEPGEPERMEIDGREIEVIRYRVRGEDVPGQRPWHGQFVVWILPGERRLPVEIVFKKNHSNVRLKLVSPSPLP